MPIGIDAGKAFMRLSIEDADFEKGLRSAQRRLRRFGTSLAGVGRSLIIGAAAAATPIALSVAKFAEFDDAIRRTAGAAQASQVDIERLSDAARKLGRETSFTASQYAGLQLVLARAGFKVDEILAATAAVADLGYATGTELPEAAEVAAATLRIFGLEASKMTDVADILTATANGSAQTLTDLFESLKLAAPIANELGLNLQQTSAALGVMANLGIKGSLAATALRRSFLQLVDPKVAAKIEENFGIEINDQALKDLPALMARIATATAKLPNTERLGILSDLFGARAVTSVAGLTKNVDQLEDFEARLQNVAGTAKRTADIMDAGLGGSIRRFLSAVEGARIAIGEALSPSLITLSNSITGATKGFAEFAEENPGLVEGVALSVAAVGGLGVALVAAGVAFTGLASLAGSAATAFSLLATPIGLSTVAIAGFLAATTDFESAIERITGGADDLTSVAESIGTALANGNINAAVELFWAKLEAAWRRGKNEFIDAVRGDNFSRTIVESLLPDEIGGVDTSDLIKEARRQQLKDPVADALDRRIKLLQQQIEQENKLQNVQEAGEKKQAAAAKKQADDRKNVVDIQAERDRKILSSLGFDPDKLTPPAPRTPEDDTNDLFSESAKAEKEAAGLEKADLAANRIFEEQKKVTAEANEELEQLDKKLKTLATRLTDAVIDATPSSRGQLGGQLAELSLAVPESDIPKKQLDALNKQITETKEVKKAVTKLKGPRFR